MRRILALPYPKAIENPATSFISKAVRKPDQIIQPYEFGDDASKGTGLWLDRLPPLRVDPSKRCVGRASCITASPLNAGLIRLTAGRTVFLRLMIVGLPGRRPIRALRRQWRNGLPALWSGEGFFHA